MFRQIGGAVLWLPKTVAPLTAKDAPSSSMDDSHNPRGLVQRSESQRQTIPRFTTFHHQVSREIDDHRLYFMNFVSNDVDMLKLGYIFSSYPKFAHSHVSLKLCPPWVRRHLTRMMSSQ